MHLVGFIITLSVASSSPIENESKLLLLAAQFDGLQVKMHHLLAQFEEEKLHRINLQALNEKLEAKIDDLMSQNTKQEEEIRLLKNRKCGDDIIQPKPQENNIIMDDVIIDPSSLISPKLPPSSCRQLSTIGHYLDGIYLVANQDTNKIETIYCDFGTSLTERLYGSVDVKSKAVHFTVQRTSAFAMENAVIPFEIERLNVGGAMNSGTGVFVAPVNGIYHFEFKGIKYNDPVLLFIYLQVNGMNIGTAYATSLPNYQGLSGISASLQLKTGDQVRLFKTTGTLHENPNLQYTFFCGWLVEEDLVLG